jgi:3-isopropylmalate/(R)-2-methylmalate dehydratase small subunit
MTEPKENAAPRRIQRVEGRAVAVRGDDIDTDRIIPARYLRCVTFEGLGEHAFEDDRRALQEKGQSHPFDERRHQGAEILVVNRNFGSGSSREHAPQALQRWGIQALVGESFAEIFFGNCVALGIPCLTAARESVGALMEFAVKNPSGKVSIDIASGEIHFSGRRIISKLPPGPRDAFLRGTWDATGLLLERYQEVEEVAARLPYLQGYQ